jgi:hypothetical protein
MQEQGDRRVWLQKAGVFPDVTQLSYLLSFKRNQITFTVP